ncbi:hypothetical protein BC939DRAFT_455784 [Gamsiella multidivaricata]|uniref:uncharacterized protein n=1 Tax=Gamsiella multidivaricata TaxID=101098 RepID=UPI002220DAB5|nr:uncharacterized protein BC939DRAFT_455784 [Gamsiella multidivaricata]KAG0365422.1 hypothetical protein BGZ54_006532 [Gamsiella multidivaricata]KAI7821352.1 hypothetical protein BC939DRAFT_455784 [Gamsiella multidivaricata]
MKFSIIASAVVSTILFTAPSVSAHVTANPNIAVSNSYFQTNFRVPHGCNGNSTDLVIVEIPKGVTSVKPHAVLPWNTTINMVPLDVPIVTPDGTINTTVGSVTWSNGQLLDSMYEDFGLQFKLPAMTGPLYWNVYQHCVNNEWNNWTSVPDANGKTTGFPAAVINVSNSTTTPSAGAVTSPTNQPSAAAAGFGSSWGHVVLAGAGAVLMAMV